MPKPRIALLALTAIDATEIPAAVRGRFELVVIGYGRRPPQLPADARWRRIPRMPLPLYLSVAGWLPELILGSVLLLRCRADVIHVAGMRPTPLQRVDIVTPRFSWAGLREAVAPHRLTGWRHPRPLIRAMAWIERRLWGGGRARLVTTMSESARRQTARLYGSSEVVSLKLTPDPDRFRPDEADRRAVRAELGGADGEVVALHVARNYNDLKGTGIAIRAVAEARARGAPVSLWIAGSGTRFRAEARRAGVAEHVRFLGWVDRPERLYRAADLFVLPTAFETGSRATREAAACELPVVVPATTGVIDVVGENEAGIVVDRTPASVAEAMTTLARDPELRRRLGREGRRRVTAGGFAPYGEQIVALYERLLAEPAED